VFWGEGSPPRVEGRGRRVQRTPCGADGKGGGGEDKASAKAGSRRYVPSPLSGLRHCFTGGKKGKPFQKGKKRKMLVSSVKRKGENSFRGAKHSSSFSNKRGGEGGAFLEKREDERSHLSSRLTEGRGKYNIIDSRWRHPSSLRRGREKSGETREKEAILNWLLTGEKAFNSYSVGLEQLSWWRSGERGRKPRGSSV